ncbi:glycosyltransferase family 2 protein [Rhodococcus sp. HNM0569]|uniref:glycosyltransferase family 2 protein n=1 Tax=Rhodococcus sp. HNM0569 TaxID=2716340 RepID=UPI001469DB74|nr:glycosyltransferase family 2 protein [Rhodococcus sp. HNM0569]NLU81488.1 glycosyltransferase [Rhodococcus sp. HNM0569]
MEKPFVVKSRNVTLVVLTIGFITVYMVWRVFFTIPTSFGIVSLVVAVLLILAELSARSGDLFDFVNIMLNKVARPRRILDIPTGLLPEVDILVPVHNESTLLVFKTLCAAKKIRYPDQRKIHIHVCDDVVRPEMERLAASLGVGYIPCHSNRGAKAGNLNNALEFTSAPLVSTIDADMIPKKNALEDMVPYFYASEHKQDPRRFAHDLADNGFQFDMGFVQGVQAFYTPDLYQFTLYAMDHAPNEQQIYFEIVNPSRGHLNASTYCGSNTLISRFALEAVGGFALDSVTEDLSTGLAIEKKGFGGIAVPARIAFGLTPFTHRDFLAQRVRWARGCFQSFKGQRPFTTGHGFWWKSCYTQIYNYWIFTLRRVIYMFVPISVVLFGITVLDGMWYTYFILWLPGYFLYAVSLRVLTSNRANAHQANVIETTLALPLFWPVLTEMFGIQRRKFVVTKKNLAGQIDGRPYWRLAITFAVLLVLNAICFVILLMRCISDQSLASLVVMLWLFVEGKNALFALYFFLGRPGFADSVRWPVQVPVAISSGHGVTRARSAFVTEDAVQLDGDLTSSFPPGAMVTATIEFPDGPVRIDASTTAGTDGNSRLVLAVDTDAAYGDYITAVHDHDDLPPYRRHTIPMILEEARDGLVRRLARARAHRRSTRAHQVPVG